MANLAYRVYEHNSITAKADYDQLAEIRLLAHRGVLEELLPTESFPLLTDRGLDREGTTSVVVWGAVVAELLADTAMLMSVVGTEMLLSYVSVRASRASAT